MRVLPLFCLSLNLLAAVAPPTPLATLLDEATRNNPDILVRRGWQAATQVPSQVSTLPDPQVTVQSFSVGSPRPFAGYSNSAFAYIGLGVSQDIPYPGKLKLKGEAAQQDAAISRDKLDAARRSVLHRSRRRIFRPHMFNRRLRCSTATGNSSIRSRKSRTLGTGLGRASSRMC